MKKLYFLVVLFLCGLSVGNVFASASAAAEAPRGLEMTDDDNNDNNTLSDRIEAHVNNCPRYVGNAAECGTDQIFCCGCCDRPLRRHWKRTGNKYLDSYLCCDVCSDVDLEFGLFPHVSACSVALYVVTWVPFKEFLKEFPSECAWGAGVLGSAAYYLLARRYEKVKADMKRE